MKNIIHTSRKYITFNLEEFLLVIVYAILLGFIFSFRSWGDPFSWIGGFLTWFSYGAFSFIAIFSIMFVQKIIGAHCGIVPTYKFTFIYIIFSLVVVFLTNGLFTFFIPPGFKTTEKLKMMLGRTRYKEAFSDYLRIGFGGVVTCVVLGLFFSAAIFPERFLQLSLIYFLYAFYSLLPFELFFSWQDENTGVSNGMAIMYPSRSIFVFSFVFIILGYILSVTQTFFFSLLFSFLIAFIIGLVWFLRREGKYHDY